MSAAAASEVSDHKHKWYWRYCQLARRDACAALKCVSMQQRERRTHNAMRGPFVTLIYLATQCVRNDARNSDTDDARLPRSDVCSAVSGNQLMPVSLSVSDVSCANSVRAWCQYKGVRVTRVV